MDKSKERATPTVVRPRPCGVGGVCVGGRNTNRDTRCQVGLTQWALPGSLARPPAVAGQHAPVQHRESVRPDGSPPRPTAARQPASQGCLARRHANRPAHHPPVYPLRRGPLTRGAPSRGPPADYGRPPAPYAIRFRQPLVRHPDTRFLLCRGARRGRRWHILSRHQACRRASTASLPPQSASRERPRSWRRLRRFPAWPTPARAPSVPPFKSCPATQRKRWVRPAGGTGGASWFSDHLPYPPPAVQFGRSAVSNGRCGLPPSGGPSAATASLFAPSAGGAGPTLSLTPADPAGPFGPPTWGGGPPRE